MATSGPQAGNRKSNGVLNISGGQVSGDAPKPVKIKPQADGEKVVIRRLPPGITEEEVWKVLGDEWRVGSGLVSWVNFEPGKLSSDPAKTSRPARVYLHVAKRESLNALAEIVQTRDWEDAKYTFNSPSLVAPPVLELAIYKKVPGGKKRSDARQGTIDQDPEFMAFLQSLTNPDQPKDEDMAEDKSLPEETTKADAKITTTPLVEFLKEKKANKAKEAANAKNAKHARQDSQGGGKAKGNPEESKRKSKDSKAEKNSDKPKETVKILTKKAGADAAKAAENTASQSSSASQEVPKSRRAGIAAAARLLQRDLGLSPGSAHRKARLDAAKAQAEAKTSAKDPGPVPKDVKDGPSSSIASNAQASTSTTSLVPPERPSTPTAPKSGRSRRGGAGKNSAAGESKSKAGESGGSTAGTTGTTAPPVVLLKKKNDGSQAQASTTTSGATPSAPSSATKSTKANGKSSSAASNQKKTPPAVVAGAVRGFVKHANPSQGVTEALLKQALEVFGPITFVEMDKRKGFAYVDFAEHEGLVQAVGASPVAVAQGTVQVLERKDKKPSAAVAAPPPTTTASGSAATPTEKGESHKRTRRGRGGKAAANSASTVGGSLNSSASQGAVSSTPAPPAGASAGAG